MRSRASASTVSGSRSSRAQNPSPRRRRLRPSTQGHMRALGKKGRRIGIQSGLAAVHPRKIGSFGCSRRHEAFRAFAQNFNHEIAVGLEVARDASATAARTGRPPVQPRRPRSVLPPEPARCGPTRSGLAARRPAPTQRRIPGREYVKVLLGAIRVMSFAPVRETARASGNVRMARKIRSRGFSSDSDRHSSRRQHPPFFPVLRAGTTRPTGLCGCTGEKPQSGRSTTAEPSKSYFVGSVCPRHQKVCALLPFRRSRAVARKGGLDRCSGSSSSPAAAAAPGRPGERETTPAGSETASGDTRQIDRAASMRSAMASESADGCPR